MSAIRKRPICVPCQHGKHEECTAIIDERDTIPEGEVREWQEACACPARACAYDVGAYDQDVEDSAAEDVGDARRDDEGGDA